MIIKNQKELEILREGGKKLAAVLAEVARRAIVGVSARELDALAEKLILKAGGKPSFKGYKVKDTLMPYPGSLCVSINDEVVHGLPTDRVLKAGDIVGLDIGMWYEGLCTDTALTVLVGGGTNKLIEATKKSLEIGIAEVRVGAHVGDIGYAIQKYLEKEASLPDGQGFSVVRELVGHGVGHAVHEDPEIPNFGKRGAGPELIEGMVIALEPMATDGSPKVKLAADGWTWLTRDGSRAAHFEHTVVVTKDGAEILTAIS
ncbi:MAG: type I methionyl aminopeptidase [Candidatus Giovannonibacteria bacterium]|nr:MAG: type I methionyl aminopeptidase [Candidatus Giovannonibacteria bacterium]